MLFLYKDIDNDIDHDHDLATISSIKGSHVTEQ